MKPLAKEGEKLSGEEQRPGRTDSRRDYRKDGALWLRMEARLFTVLPLACYNSSVYSTVEIVNTRKWYIGTSPKYYVKWKG